MQLRGGRDNCISEIAGVGIDKYEGSSSVGIDDGYVKDFGEYILYLGRISEGKNCDQLLAFFESYIKKEPNRNVKLLLAGSLSLDVDKYQHGYTCPEKEVPAMPKPEPRPLRINRKLF